MSFGKRGRVLSGKSEKMLREAQDHCKSAHTSIEACLKQLEADAESDDEGKGLVKGVVPGDVSEKKADEGTAWSAPTLGDFTPKSWGDLTAAETKRIAGHFAWAEEMPPKSFGSLKLGHHRPSDGAVVWRGVAAAMGALLGARGGVDIPEADRRKVYEHLAKHARAFDKEPPEFKAAEPVMLKLASEPETSPDPVLILTPDEEILFKLRNDEPEKAAAPEPSFTMSADDLQALRREVRNSVRASLTAVTGRLYDEE
jgi:hypothetical protein